MTKSNGDYRRGAQVLLHILKKPSYVLLGISMYPLLLWLFIYLTNLNLFLHVWRETSLATIEKWQFLLGSITNVFTRLPDPLATSIVIFAGLATLNIVTLVYTLRQRSKVDIRSSGGAATVAVVGSHCMACGGAILAPVITALSGSGAFISAARANTAIFVSLSINLLAIMVILHATLKLASRADISSLRN